MRYRFPAQNLRLAGDNAFDPALERIVIGERHPARELFVVVDVAKAMLLAKSCRLIALQVTSQTTMLHHRGLLERAPKAQILRQVRRAPERVSNGGAEFQVDSRMVARRFGPKASPYAGRR